jgi:hypothetical protein
MQEWKNAYPQILSCVEYRDYRLSNLNSNGAEGDGGFELERIGGAKNIEWQYTTIDSNGI